MLKQCILAELQSYLRKVKLNCYKLLPNRFIRPKAI